MKPALVFSMFTMAKTVVGKFLLTSPGFGMFPAASKACKILPKISKPITVVCEEAFFDQVTLQVTTGTTTSTGYQDVTIPHLVTPC